MHSVECTAGRASAAVIPIHPSLPVGVNRREFPELTVSIATHAEFAMTPSWDGGLYKAWAGWGPKELRP